MYGAPDVVVSVGFRRLFTTVWQQSSAGVSSSVVRVDNPLPGDLVVRRRLDEAVVRRGEVFVITHWPDAETIVAGPYQSYGYALRQAQGMLKDRSERIWYDHAPTGRPEQLEQVGGHGHA